MRKLEVDRLDKGRREEKRKTWDKIKRIENNVIGSRKRKEISKYFLSKKTPKDFSAMRKFKSKLNDDKECKN